MEPKTKRARRGTQPNDVSLLLHFTFQQHHRLKVVAGSLGISQAETLRLLIDERYVKQALTCPATLGDTQPASLD